MKKKLLTKLLNDLKLSNKDEMLNSFNIRNIKFCNENELTLFIDSNKYLSPEIVSEFIEKSSLFFGEYNFNTHLNITEKLNITLLKDYFHFCVENLCLTEQVNNILKNRNLKYEENSSELILEVYNEYEYKSINGSINEIYTMFCSLGINIDIVCKAINHELDLDLQLEEIVKKAYIDNNVNKNKKTSSVTKVTDNNNIIYGKKISKVTHKMDQLEPNLNNVCVEGEVFDIDIFKTKNNKHIVTIYITDYSESLAVKVFLGEKAKELESITTLKGKYIKVFGHMTYDTYFRSDILRANAISLEEKKTIYDTEENKRVELHIHTNMSAVDSVIDVNSLVKYAKNNGYNSFGVVDHNSVQAFPALYNATKNSDIKVIYGVEFDIVDDKLDIVQNNSNNKLINFDDTFIVFDLETTGLNPYGNDRIFEFGAVKVKNGEIIDSFSELCNPDVELSDKIIEITNVKNSMLIGKRLEKDVLIDFVDWIEDFTLVAHNASFDFGFIKTACDRFGLRKLNNAIIDTLGLSRILNPQWGRHGLAALVKKYKIKLENHHRAHDDAKATSYVFINQINEIKEKNITNISEMNNYIDRDEIFKYGKTYHLTALVKNNVGLKNLFKLVSLANTKYFHKGPKILKSEIEKYREGLLLGSSCVNGEIFQNVEKYSDIELENIMKFYDYIEVQPPLIYDHLIQTSSIDSLTTIYKNIKKIVDIGINSNKVVVASGDVHHLLKRDKILREIIINNPIPGGGFHSLKKSSIESIPSQHYRTTLEMLNEFEFLGIKVAKEIVIDNPNYISNLIENVTIIKDQLFTPKLKDSDILTKEMVYSKAKSIYGSNLPKIILDRIEKELNSIIGHGYDVIYLISSQLVTKSLNDGYLVGSRGSVGSSFVATMMDITEVNPLTPHYICPNCKYYEFVNDNNYSCGYDLPSKLCPECSNALIGEGHDIPFETFLGFEGDKVPDIDLNFSGEYQSKAHDYTKVLFGEDFVYRAGTISTIAEKTAFGYVKGYEKDKNKDLSNSEVKRLAIGCQGVKRGTGQHPGGIIVVPSNMSIYDFTPIQFPADDTTSSWKTTHFDFHAIHDNLLKLDILGHDDPTILHMLNKISNIDSKNVDFNRGEVFDIFSSPKSLGIDPISIKLRNGNNYILFSTGTLGIPEFGTRFVIEMLKDTQPKSFAELVKISGLSHGTDVWLNNGQYLIRNNICEFKDVIGCRDDIMVYLLQMGLEPRISFKIMEDVRKGKGLNVEYEDIMKKNNVPSWYIDSCKKIKYMFPKAHACAYVLMAVRIAYFKVFEPIYFYATYFSIRVDDFEIDTMILGKAAILERITEILNKEYDATTKEKNILSTLEISLEMIERGYSFSDIDLNKSDATNFLVEGKTLIPPFRSIDGLGINVALNLVKERNEREYSSIDDLKVRGKVNKTILIKFELLNIIDHLPEGDQLTLF
ncbi:MAG: PolC-type DNA polymerase III [Bacilli bacterium]